MFKTKKELIKENEMPSENDIDNAYNNGLHMGVAFAFESFVERINFYTFYKEASGRLQREKPNDYKKFLEHRSGKWHEIGIENWNKDYRKWLFDYCFGDVIE